MASASVSHDVGRLLLLLWTLGTLAVALLGAGRWSLDAWRGSRS